MTCLVHVSFFFFACFALPRYHVVSNVFVSVLFVCITSFAEGQYICMTAIITEISVICLSSMLTQLYWIFSSIQSFILILISLESQSQMLQIHPKNMPIDALHSNLWSNSVLAIYFHWIRFEDFPDCQHEARQAYKRPY